MSGLKLAPGVELPPEAMLQRFGILAMSGAGKSNAAVVMAEEMYDADIPWVAVDPKGDWWGVRSSASGKGPGLNVPIFGGLHGDVPLEQTAGKMMAELVADKRLTCVLDISEMTKGQQLRFLTDFAETLLRKNRSPLQVIAEEADEYLPQRVMRREAQCVGAWAKLVKRGRFRGIFVTLVTQRSASLSKDALSQIDTLIPMRVGDPRDKRALKEWVVEHDIGQEMFDSLPRLDDGEAWLWSPHKLRMMERMRFRRRRTFDSGATPDWEDRDVARLADVDLGEIEAAIADTIERAKAEDPRELRSRIAGLEKELRERPGVEPKEVRVEVEVPVFPDELKEQVVKLLEKVGDQAGKVLETSGSLIELAKSNFDMLEIRPMPRQTDMRPVKVAAKTPQPRRLEPSVAGVDGDIRLGRASRKILQTLVERHPMALTRAQVSTLSGYKPRSSTFANALSELRTNGLMDDDSKLFACNDASFEHVGEMPASPKTPEEVRMQWLDSLPLAPRTILETLIEGYPRDYTRDLLSDHTGYSQTSSTFANALSTLRINGLIKDLPGKMLRVSEDLFL
jgi:hypothetical protein